MLLHPLATVPLDSLSARAPGSDPVALTSRNRQGLLSSRPLRPAILAQLAGRMRCRARYGGKYGVATCAAALFTCLLRIAALLLQCNTYYLPAARIAGFSLRPSM